MTLADHETYRRPPFSARRIRSGVDACRAALAEAQAIREGVDPMDAADIAEGEAAARRLIRSKPCRHCRAQPGRPCVRVGAAIGTNAEMDGYHSCRIEDAQLYGGEAA